MDLKELLTKSEIKVLLIASEIPFIGKKNNYWFLYMFFLIILFSIGDSPEVIKENAKKI